MDLKVSFTPEIYYAILIVITIRFKDKLCTYSCDCDCDSTKKNRNSNSHHNRKINLRCEWSFRHTMCLLTAAVMMSRKADTSLFIYLTNTKCSESPNVYFHRTTVSWQRIGYLFCFLKDGTN